MAKMGPTWEYDEGKPQHPADRGGINVALSIRNGKLMVEFGTLLSFILMTKQQALVFADALTSYARKLP